MTARSTSSSSSTPMRGIRRGSWRWSCTPTSWARRTGSNTSAAPSPISADTRTSCSGAASRSSTGIWGSGRSERDLKHYPMRLKHPVTPAQAGGRVNPDALAIAPRLGGVAQSRDRPLAGIPILLKDNIATGAQQHTTAGSLALAEARGIRDATLVARLRRAGAVVLGKANLTEFANILAIDMPAGYSSLGGQVKNPYAPALDERGVPIVSPGGSSSGSAAAVAAGLCAAAIGTETPGSLLAPAAPNGLVTGKPTVGLVSRAGILPIAHRQDTARPLTCTVRAASILLNVIAVPDPA